MVPVVSVPHLFITHIGQHAASSLTLAALASIMQSNIAHFIEVFARLTLTKVEPTR